MSTDIKELRRNGEIKRVKVPEYQETSPERGN